MQLENFNLILHAKYDQLVHKTTQLQLVQRAIVVVID